MRLFTRSGMSNNCRRKPTSLCLLLVGFLCCSLIAMGTLFWVDNSWALITDHDPLTAVNIGPYLDDCVDEEPEIKADQDGDGVIPIAGGLLIRGNGDRDDNRGEEFKIVRCLSGSATTETTAAVSNFKERRTVAAYKDFGHLKVMPAGDGISNTASSPLLTTAKGLPCIAGGLYFWRSLLQACRQVRFPRLQPIT